MANYVEGYVYDETGMGAIGIPVVLKGTTTGTPTDADGYYKITPLSTNQMNTGILVVSYVGYKTVEVPIQNRSYLDIHLELEDEPVDPEPEPERPFVDSNKIVTVQDVVNFLINDKDVFLEQASNQGYPTNRCVTAELIRTIADDYILDLDLTVSLNGNRLVKYGYLSERLFSIKIADFNEMFDFYGYQYDSIFKIASTYDHDVWDGDIYPTSNVSYEGLLTITGTRKQWQCLYDSIYNEEAESNSITLINDYGEELRPSTNFYSALNRIVNGSWDTIQEVYISPLYTLTIQDWKDWASSYAEYDGNWMFAENIDGPFLDGGDYPTSNLYYYDGNSTSTITGYIWQWQNLIDYVDYNFDGEWEYLGLAVPDEEWTDSYNFSNVSSAIQDIVNEEQDQVANFLETTTVAKSVTVEPNFNGGWVLDNTNNPSTSSYNMYQSNTNKGVSNSVDMMKVTFKGYDSFTIYIRSYGETYWDYVVASSLNYVLPTTSSSYPGGSTSSPTMSGAAAMTKNNSQSGTALSYYTPVTYSNLDPNTQYYITVAYRKDGSGNQNDDRGYVLIPKTSSTGTFSISPTSKQLTSSAQTFAVSVTNTTGKTYSVSSNASWITVYDNSPNITVSANTSTSSRYGTVTFTCNGMSRTVSITQSGSSSTYSIPIYYVQKGWCDEEDFEIDARLSASFTGSYSATICNNLAITDGWGQSGWCDSRSIINTFNISASQLSNTYLNFWGYDNDKQEGRVYVVKVSADGERELVSSILYLEEFGGSSASPSIRIWMSNVQQGDSFEIWFEQGDTTYGIDNSLQ